MTSLPSGRRRHAAPNRTPARASTSCCGGISYMTKVRRWM